MRIRSIAKIITPALAGNVILLAPGPRELQDRACGEKKTWEVPPLGIALQASVGAVTVMSAAC
jgi:hypothetical protein